MKLKIAHFCKVYYPIKGGVQAVVKRISEGLEEEFDITIISTNSEPRERRIGKLYIKEMKAIGELFSMPISFGFLLEAKKAIRLNDIVIAHYPFPLLDLIFGFFSKKNTKLIVYWHSEIVSQKFTKKFVYPLTQMMLAKSDAIVCSSPNLIIHSKILNQYKQKCHIIPFGIKVNEELIKNIDLPSNSDYFVCIARHVPYKGIDILLRAFAISKSNFRLVLIGSGPLLNQHMKLAEELSLESMVEFKTKLNDDALEGYLKECRALVLPSILPSEAFALVQIEAMSLARPIINTNLKSGVPWVARNNKEAITVEPNNIEQLASALKKFSDNELVNGLGYAAKERYDSKFSYQTFCELTKDLYLKLVST